MEGWQFFFGCVAVAAVVGLLYWLARNSVFVEAAKPFFNFVGGTTAIISGAFWMANAHIALIEGTNERLTNIANMFNLWAAVSAFIAALLLIIPFVLDKLSQPEKQDEDTLLSSIDIACSLVELPIEIWQRELVRRAIHADKIKEVLQIMKDILKPKDQK